MAILHNWWKRRGPPPAQPEVKLLCQRDQGRNAAPAMERIGLVLKCSAFFAIRVIHSIGPSAGTECRSSASPLEIKETIMRFLRVPFALAVTIGFVLTCAVSAQAQTKFTIGKVVGGDGFHIPTYVAVDEGMFKAEGLDASLVELQPNSQVAAVLSGNLDCAPIPSGGAQAALSGAKIMYIVGESLKSQWTLVTGKNVNDAAELKEKTIGLGRPGGADYDEVQAVLHRFFHMDAGKDYKVISFQAEPERIAALSNGDIQGAGLSIPHAVVAQQAGLKILLRTGDYIPRAGGTIFCMQSFVEQHPDTVKKVIRAIAKAVMYFRTNKEGSMKVMEKEIGSIKNDTDAGLIWDQLHNSFGAEVPADLFKEILESRRQTMIAARQWPADKPLPDPESFLARNLLESTLKEMGYVPANLAPPTKSN
jgi:NitT/TauT family transport system substrate-binding protein